MTNTTFEKKQKTTFLLLQSSTVRPKLQTCIEDGNDDVDEDKDENDEDMDSF